jgi:hypothetical protein
MHINYDSKWSGVDILARNLGEFCFRFPFLCWDIIKRFMFMLQVLKACIGNVVCV